MPLTSPRFRQEADFNAVAAARKAIRRGARGRLVHLIQMALLDLGFRMPISTGSNDFSPDGIFGAETERVVKEFQRTVPGLNADGVVGQHTMGALDDKFPSFTHRINLHFRALSLTDVPFDRMMSSTERVYAQYGIEARFASGASLALSEADQNRFNIIKQNCDWVMDSGEFFELQQMGPSFPLTDIGVFIVNKFQQTEVLGCGGHSTNEPACTVTHDCRRWDVAHELCHVLLTSAFVPAHTSDTRNLMFVHSNHGDNPLALTEKQLARIRLSPLCRAI